MLFAFAGFVTALLTAASAQATFKGANGRIAFSSPNPPANSYDLYSINADGSGETRINSGTLGEWSPDGRKLVVVKGFNANAELYLMNADGSGLRRLTNNSLADTSPAWSPDGQRIAFARRQPQEQEAGDDLYVLDADGTETSFSTCQPPPPNQAPCPWFGGLSWSPDGERIALHAGSWVRDSEEGGWFHSSSGIGTIDPDTGFGTALTDWFNFDRTPDFSPNGGKVVFARDFAPPDLYVIDADGSNETAIAGVGGAVPVWSPSGTKIAKLVQEGCCVPSHVYTMNADGSGEARLTATPAINGGVFSEYDGLSWQPLAATPYPRPGTATPLSVPLVPAFAECTAPNSQHVAPLDSPSCSPPVEESELLTTSSVGRGVGKVVLKVEIGIAATAADEADVRIVSSFRDTECRAAATPGCTAAGGDYEGKLLLRIKARITDPANGGFGTLPATVSDAALSFPMDCVPTVNPKAGSRCNLDVSGEALVPGLFNEGSRTVISALSVAVLDAGPDGSLTPFAGNCPPTCGTGDEKTFLRQGLFTP